MLLSKNAKHNELNSSHSKGMCRTKSVAKRPDKIQPTNPDIDHTSSIVSDTAFALHSKSLYCYLSKPTEENRKYITKDVRRTERYWIIRLTYTVGFTQRSLYYKLQVIYVYIYQGSQSEDIFKIRYSCKCANNVCFPK